jgi:hypothetical protein
LVIGVTELWFTQKTRMHARVPHAQCDPRTPDTARERKTRIGKLWLSFVFPQLVYSDMPLNSEMVEASASNRFIDS